MAGVTIGWASHAYYYARKAPERLLEQLIGASRSAHQMYTLVDSVSVEFPPEDFRSYNELLGLRTKLQLDLVDIENGNIAFLGARLLPLRGSPSAFLVFEKDGVRFSIIALPTGNDEAAPELVRRAGDLPVTIRRRPHFTLVTVGKLPDGGDSLLRRIVRYSTTDGK